MALEWCQILVDRKHYFSSLFYKGFTINYTVICNNILFFSLWSSFHSLTYTMYTIYKLSNNFHTHNHTQDISRNSLSFHYISLMKILHTFITSATFVHHPLLLRLIKSRERYCIFIHKMYAWGKSNNHILS